MKIVKFMEKHWSTIFSTAALIVFMTATVVLAAGGGGGEHHSPGMFDKDTIYRMMNFGVLAGALFFIARKPVAEFFSSRIKGIQEELESLEQKKQAAEQELAKYETKIAKLDEEAETIVAEYVQQGEDAKKRILAEAEAQAEKLEEMAKRNIEQEFKAAKASLRNEIAELALDQAETLVRESISTEDQDRLVDDYLNKVVAS